MLSYLLQVSFCLAAFYALYVVFFSGETFFNTNRWYLLGTVGISMAMPLMLLLPEGLISQGDVVFSQTLEPIAIRLQDTQVSLDTSQGQFGWVQALLLIYWTGILFLGLRFARQLLSILHAYRNGQVVSRGNGYTLIYTDQPHPPYSFFSLIFLYRDHQLTHEELEEILAHENAHASALHSIDVLLMELACIFLWPSPIIYFYRKSLRRVHEYLADAAVLRHTSFAHYGELLLAQSGNQLQAALANHFFQSQLKHRFDMMTKHKSRRIAFIKYLAFLPIVLLVLALFSFRKSETPNTAHEIPHAYQDSIPGSDVYKVVEEMPRFPGCEDSGLQGDELFTCAQGKLLEYVSEHILYPKEAKEAGVSGRVVAKFVIRQDGTPVDVDILKSLGHGTDEVVLDILNNMPRWRPGYHKGKAVDVELTLPVSFKFNDDVTGKTSSSPVVVTTIGKSNNIEKELYTVVDEMPRFPGCEDAGLTGEELTHCAFDHLIDFVIEHMKYPIQAKEAGIEGTVLVKFVVRADGSISDPAIKKSLGYGTDEAALSIVAAMQRMTERWQPGHQNGKAVNVEMVLPIAFRMSAETPDAKTYAFPEALSLEEFTVYPVPANGRVNYSIKGLQGDAELRVCDAAGNIVFGKEVRGESIAGEIDIVKLSSGTYTVSIVQGKKIQSKQIVLK